MDKIPGPQLTSAGDLRYAADHICGSGAKHNGKPAGAPAVDEDTATPATDHATVGANLADHLKDSPYLEKLSALVASALVASGVQTIRTGIKEHDRKKILEGSKTTLWGAFQGLNAADKIFTCLNDRSSRNFRK